MGKQSHKINVRAMKVPALFILFLFLSPRATATDLIELREVPKNFWDSLKEEGRPEGLLTLLAAGGAASIARFGGTQNFNDFRTADTLQRHKPLGARATDFGSFIGNPIYLLPAAVTTYFVGGSFDAHTTQEFGLLSSEALALAGLETEVLKFSVPRLRPDHSDLAAFPSGHTSASFALATVAASQWGWDVGVPAYAVAGFVGYSRMESNKHYLSDVLFGAGLGIASGRAVYKVRRRAHPGRYAFMPFVSPGGGGLEVLF
jgi:membrane-associated phospholipid phosphatase